MMSLGGNHSGKIISPAINFFMLGSNSLRKVRISTSISESLVEEFLYGRSRTEINSTKGRY
jgi:hypothetical protein